MREPEKFDLDKIVGYYGKTKAMATQLVFDAVKEEGLKACVVYPTGICGPNDYVPKRTHKKTRYVLPFSFRLIL